MGLSYLPCQVWDCYSCTRASLGWVLGQADPVKISSQCARTEIRDIKPQIQKKVCVQTLLKCTNVNFEASSSHTHNIMVTQLQYAEAKTFAQRHNGC